jgi:hypothetical protein
MESVRVEIFCKQIGAKRSVGWPDFDGARSLGMALMLLLALMVSACGGGGGDSTNDPLESTGVSGSATVNRGTLLTDDWAAYPRLVRLSHQSVPANNGRIVASVSERVQGRWRPGFHLSNDDGLSFHPLSSIADDRLGNGICCGTLFEMPQAVGTLAAGTLLYSTSSGADVPGTFMEQPIYRSDDAGASFAKIDGAACGRSTVPRGSSSGSGVWEPEFFIAADGALACVYSDETEAAHSQVLKITVTHDGEAWTVPRMVVSGPQGSDRPGMATVRRTIGGRYAMSFENCSAASLDCRVWLKYSQDGSDWGDPRVLGSSPRSAGGRYFRHTPTMVMFDPPSNALGAIALIGQILVDPSGNVDIADNGRALMMNDDADVEGAWHLASSPIGLQDAPLESNWCQNYSTALLPTLDGRRLLMMQTDRTADGGCVARFGQAELNLTHQMTASGPAVTID